MIRDAEVIIRLPQDRDTPLQRGQCGGFAWRYRYERATDARVADACGQDYLTLHVVDETLTFALCDGVSHSFLGDVAARFLGDSLLGWLDQATIGANESHVLAILLHEHLSFIVPVATEKVTQTPLPARMPELQREALELARERGSESTFVCGRIDYSRRVFAQGRVMLAWMGDSNLRIWGPDGEISGALGDSFDIAQRWSTRRGLIGGAPHIFVCPLFDRRRLAISRVVAYSDGLKSLDYSAPPDDDALDDAIHALTDIPTSDDVSFIDIVLLAAQS